MNNLKNDKNYRGSKELSRIFSSRIITAMVIYTVAIIVGVIAVFIAYHMTSFSGSSLIYASAQLFKRHMYCFFGVVWLAGLAMIIWFYWQKTLQYLDLVAAASHKLIEKEDSLIELPREMSQIAQQMNDAKQNAIRSEGLAREAEKKKSDLIVYLAHDLKTPLTSVIGYLSLLQEAEEISAETQKKYLSVSLERAERLESLINEFFEIARFNLSSVSLEYSRVNLTRMLEQISDEFKPVLQEKNLTCRVMSYSDVMLCFDVGKMERVFDNLMRNAMNYSYEDTEILINLKALDDQVEVSFRNEGDIIPEEKLQRIFEQFYRVDTARMGKTGGAGLGLAISKEIVELHGGRITAKSEKHMVEFMIKLPARQ